MKRMLLGSLLSCMVVGQTACLNISDVANMMGRSAILGYASRFVASFTQALAIPAAIGYFAKKTKTGKAKNAIRGGIALQTIAKLPTIGQALYREQPYYGYGGYCHGYNTYAIFSAVGHALGSACAWYLSGKVDKA